MSRLALDCEIYALHIANCIFALFFCFIILWVFVSSASGLCDSLSVYDGGFLSIDDDRHFTL